MPIDINSEMKFCGEYLRGMNSLDFSDDDFDTKNIKQISFLYNQLICHGNKGQRYSQENINIALEIYLRSSNCYRSLRELLILPHPRTLKRYFGKLGTPGSGGECATVVENVFSALDDKQRRCYITADEMYVWPAIRYQGGHVIGYAANEE